MPVPSEGLDLSKVTQWSLAWVCSSDYFLVTAPVEVMALGLLLQRWHACTCSERGLWLRPAPSEGLDLGLAPQRPMTWVWYQGGLWFEPAH